MLPFKILILISLEVAIVSAGLEQISHVVLFMQENRAFDHYYGTMAGVRNFKDPNVLLHANGKPIWYQKTNHTETDSYLLPYYLNEDPQYSESNECLYFGSNDWTPNHNAWNFGKIDGWVTGNAPSSWSYYKRDDIKTHFDIAEGWTVADMYAESVIGPTNPNRITWISGTINVPGSPPGPALGGPSIENHQTPGCNEDANGNLYDCYPVKWKTYPEYLEEAGIDWYVFQDKNNFGDDPIAYFTQGQTSENTTLIQKGNSFSGLESFYERAANGTLPPVSWIIGPQELSEHPPNRPIDGAWLQKKVVDAVINSPKYNETALFISYDETGGLGDHVPPFISPEGTEGEWFYNPENLTQYVPSGPGFRVPFYVISPFTRGGKVFTAPSDHNSQLLFVESWIQSKFGKNVTQAEMNSWRREHMSNLVDIFDFENPDFSLPSLTPVPHPLMKGENYLQPYLCDTKWNARKSPIPYDNQTEDSALYTEEGFKQIRGALTEGRYLVLQDTESGKCLKYDNSELSLHACPEDFEDEQFTFVVVQIGDSFSKAFKLVAHDGSFVNVGSSNVLLSDTFFIDFDPSSGYRFNISLTDQQADIFNIFSVTYNLLTGFLPSKGVSSTADVLQSDFNSSIAGHYNLTSSFIPGPILTPNWDYIEDSESSVSLQGPYNTSIGPIKNDFASALSSQEAISGSYSGGTIATSDL